jgi:hypothetical protein
MKIEDMNEGVQIIIERIKTHPEEFEETFDGRWYDIIRSVLERVENGEKSLLFLHDDEIHAIYNELREMRRNDFTASVLHRLVDSETPEVQMTLPYIPAIPTVPSKTYHLSRSEVQLAKRLGISLKTFAESKKAAENK